jgi:hypothetical protein
LTACAWNPFPERILNPCVAIASKATVDSSCWIIGDISHDSSTDILYRKLLLFEGQFLASSDAVLFASSVAPRTFPSDFYNDILNEAPRTAPMLGANVARSQPYCLILLPLPLVLVLVLLLASGTTDIFFVEVFEMVPVMIFPREGLLRTRAFGVVAREFIFHVCVYILVMAFEVGRPAKDTLFPKAWPGVLAGKLVLFGTSYKGVRILER